MKPVFWFGWVLGLCSAAWAAEEGAAAAADETVAGPEVPTEKIAWREAEGPVTVYVIPVRGVIAQPVFYVLRRGLKEANDRGATAVVLDMDTPGGSAGVMLDMMEALDKFQGETLTYVNPEAGSAGALIAAVTDEIHFAPKAVMGAAELIMGTGHDVGEGLKRKMNSYINAKIRAYSSTDPLRAQVLRAMMDPEFELEVDGEVLKPSGELLTVTAREAARMFGDPPRPLLAAGVHESLEDLLTAKYGKDGYTLTTLEVTWSEELARFLTKLAPMLMGLGLLGLFIEFKTPGFGVFGIGGGLLLAIAFFGHHAAGLSGHEAALVFGLGVVLVAVEVLLVPGTLIAGLTGVLLMLGALVWSMVDYWPTQPLEFSGDVFLGPLASLALGLTITVVGAVILIVAMPRDWVWNRMVLSAEAGTGAAAVAPNAPTDTLIGREGVTTSALRPAGQIEIDGVRHEARVAYGFIDRGAPVRVTGRQGGELIVEPAAGKEASA